MKLWRRTRRTKDMPTPLDTARDHLTKINDRLNASDPNVTGADLAEAGRRVSRLEQLEREVAEAEAETARIEAEHARRTADPQAEAIKARMTSATDTLTEARDAFDAYLRALRMAVEAYNREHGAVVQEVRADARRMGAFGLEVNS
jgi:hypothetical protein